MMKESLGQYTARDGKSLSFRKWKGPGEVIIYIHGIESNSGWFAGFASCLNDRGFTLYGVDRRGSGLNKESRGAIADYNTFLDDIEDVVIFVRRQNVDKRIFLMGICWGGLLAVNYTAKAKNPPDGLILLSPAIYRRVGLNFFMKSIAKFCNLVCPEAHFKIPIRDSMFTSNQRYLDFIKNDAMRLRSLTCRFFNEIVKIENEGSGINHQVHIPVAVLLAGGDRIVDNKKIEEWFERLESGDKTIETFLNRCHVLPFEDNAEPLVDFITNWIRMRKAPLEGQHIKS